GQGHRARKFRPEDFATNDLILALDTDHFDWLQQHAPREASSKIRLLREFDPAADQADLGIADPWYGDLADFEETYRLITAALPSVVE
ncbi:protein tyrosine phosphatase, partial [Enterococcus faecium]